MNETTSQSSQTVSSFNPHIFKSDAEAWGLVSFTEIMVFKVDIYGHTEQINYPLPNFIRIIH